MRVSQPVYSCKLDQFDGVGMICQMWALREAFRKWNGFGGDVITDQPSHPCLVVHNTECHVTLFVLPFSERLLEQCAFMKCLVCLWVNAVHSESVCFCNDRPQWFHKSALKVSVIHCHSIATLASVCWLSMERCGEQHAMHGCECCR